MDVVYTFRSVIFKCNDVERKMESVLILVLSFMDNTYMGVY